LAVHMIPAIIAGGATVLSLLGFAFNKLDSTVGETSQATKERLGQVEGLLVDLDTRLTPLLQGLSSIPGELGHQIEACLNGVRSLVQTEQHNFFEQAQVLLKQARSIAIEVTLCIAQALLFLLGVLSLVYWILRYFGIPLPIALGLTSLGVATWLRLSSKGSSSKSTLGQYPTPHTHPSPEKGPNPSTPTPAPNPFNPSPSPAPISKKPSIVISFPRKSIDVAWGIVTSVRFTVTNAGTGDARSIHCYISRSYPLSASSKSSWIISRLGPGESSTLTFSVCPKDSSQKATVHQIEICSSHQSTITASIAIRVPPRPINRCLMRSVTLRCKEWVYYAGGGGNKQAGEETTFTLGDGEYIKGVRLYINVVNRSMKFITNKRESSWYGTDQSGEFVEVLAPAGMGLESFTCKSGLFWFWAASKGFRPSWAPIYEN